MYSISLKKGKMVPDKEWNTSQLQPKGFLFDKIWKNNKLIPIVSRKLMSIAEQVLESMDIDVEIEDIILTGSIASFNWHEGSDIDLHIVFDFEKIDKNYALVKKMLDQSRINWNKTHDIHIAGKEVELYFQDASEVHEANGVWSLPLNRWIAEPVKIEMDVDIGSTEKKAEAIAQCIEHVSELFERGDYEEAYKYSSKIKRKISKMRRTGLARDGIYSPENLAFKMLRNAGWLGTLSSLKISAFDKKMSLQLELNKKIDFNKSWKDYLN